jgi:hypothetical protein
MYADSFVFGIVARKTCSGDARLATKLRELTVIWSRYEYRGRILEGATVESVLDEAVELGYRWCILQASGNLVLEGRQAEGMRERFQECAAQLIADRTFLALGAIIGDAEQGYGLDDQCLIVDVRRYHELGHPAFGVPSEVPVERIVPKVLAVDVRCGRAVAGSRMLVGSGQVERSAVLVRGWNFVETSLRQGLPVYDLGPMLDQRCLGLGRLSRNNAHEFARYLDADIRLYRDDQTGLDRRTRRLLTDVQQNVVNATRGVFLWNLEPYDDVAKPPRGFEAPISSLYCVASGFKPNAILESLGFDDSTRVVFFDYSARALEARRMLLAEWDGTRFPEFVEYLFQQLPANETHYHLASGATPQTLDWSAVDQAWTRELETWGGEQTFKEHWSRYRKLAHEFVHCDLLSGAPQLLARVRPERAAVIWWSNAFFTVYGNWLFSVADRRRIYEDWILALTDRNPDLFLYGSDFSNISVNDIQAGEYLRQVRSTDSNELVPLKTSALEIRF